MSRPLTLRLTDTAESDLAEIWFYVAGEASEAAATRLIDKIKDACEPLRHFPESAPLREHFAPGLRAAFSSNYAIYYVHDERELVIVRVLHGARDAPALAAHGGFVIRDER
ncbi:MAG: type II toxin-antitoxin system RelE/ParE family toxin [Roseiarcus sp.]|uniref:type II toxin-antitoxin system RelE/ParE family toxin n=1 Tax=Roseiarcus sp. TaxID=1969460 RepID=UPI003C627B05